MAGYGGALDQVRVPHRHVRRLMAEDRSNLQQRRSVLR